MHSDRSKLDVLVKYFWDKHYNETPIRQDKETQQYYIRVGMNRLLWLLKDQSTVDFLYRYTINTVFWDIRPPSFANLHTGLVTNSINELNLKELQRDFHQVKRLTFYTQLIRENRSLTYLKLELSEANIGFNEWLVAALVNNDHIAKVDITVEPSFLSSSEKRQHWNTLRNAMSTFKKQRFTFDAVESYLFHDEATAIARP